MANVRFLSTTNEYQWIERPKGPEGDDTVSVTLMDGTKLTNPSDVSVLRFALEGFVPTQGQMLAALDDILAYTELKRALREGSPSGYVALDSTQVDVAKKVLAWVVPQQRWFEELPGLLRVLDQAPNEVPADADAGQLVPFSGARGLPETGAPGDPPEENPEQ